jgi:hypothetical protein
VDAVKTPPTPPGQTVIPPVPPTQQKGNGMNIIFVFLAFVVIVLVGVGGYYLGTSQRTPSTRACTLEAMVCPDGSSVGRSGPNCAFAPCPTLLPTVKVEQPTTSVQATKPMEAVPSPQTNTITIKSQDQNFFLNAPSGWQSETETDTFSTGTRITKGEYALVIRTNTATEGTPCGFKDAPISSSEMFPDVSGFQYDTYTEISGNMGKVFRRVDNTANPSAGKSFFAVCQKSGTNWMQPTSYGFIMYEVPYDDNAETTYASALKVMDAMVASLQTAK